MEKRSTPTNVYGRLEECHRHQGSPEEVRRSPRRRTPRQRIYEAKKSEAENSEANIPETKDPRQRSPQDDPELRAKNPSGDRRGKNSEVPRRGKRHSATGTLTRACQHQAARAGLSRRLAIIKRESPIAGDPKDPRTEEEDPTPPTCLKSTEDRRLRQPEGTPLRDRGDGPSLSQSGSSVQTVEAARCRSK